MKELKPKFNINDIVLNKVSSRVIIYKILSINHSLIDTEKFEYDLVSAHDLNIILRFHEEFLQELSLESIKEKFDSKDYLHNRTLLDN